MLTFRFFSYNLFCSKGIYTSYSVNLLHVLYVYVAVLSNFSRCFLREDFKSSHYPSCERFSKTARLPLFF